MILGPKSSCSKILDQADIPPSIQEHLLFKPSEHCFQLLCALATTHRNTAPRRGGVDEMFGSQKFCYIIAGMTRDKDQEMGEGVWRVREGSFPEH